MGSFGKFFVLRRLHDCIVALQGSHFLESQGESGNSKLLESQGNSGKFSLTSTNFFYRSITCYPWWAHCY
jgi:hypothetical protein